MVQSQNVGIFFSNVPGIYKKRKKVRDFDSKTTEQNFFESTNLTQKNFQKNGRINVLGDGGHHSTGHVTPASAV